jgi:hypothetical protein
MNDLFPDAIQLRDAGIRNGTRVFTLEHYFRYISSYGTITVPTGFITDGASVPRMFWPIFDPFGGDYFHAAIVHDYLYARWSTAHFNCDRGTADLIFKEAMFNRGINWPTRETIFRAVRIGGWRSYKKK